jgi:hypothetical protein
MHRGLRQCLRHDCRLKKLNTKTQVNQRMQKPGVKARQHVVCAGVGREEVFL